MIKKFKDIVMDYKKEVIISAILILFLSIFFIGKAYAALTPTKSIIIKSKNSSYENKDPGAWQIEKSSKWLSKGRARVSFDVDTIAMSQNDNTDIMIVLDVSNSMSNDKLGNIKKSSTALIEKVLSNSNNNVSLISFSDNYNILSSFTNEKDMLINQINSLQVSGSTNYYQALVGVDSVLKNYTSQEDRDTVVLFISGGNPNADTPNQISQYRYLKDIYPYITINAIQYEFGKEILSSIKEVSDHQFLANHDNLSNILAKASLLPVKYDKFQVIDYIDNRYFTLGSVDDIAVSQGKVKLEFDRGQQKIVWVVDDLKSGDDIKLTMDINLKEEFIGKNGVYTTNEKEEITTKIGVKEENVVSMDTPFLAEGYRVIYEGNAPGEMNVNNVPGESNHSVFDTVTISTEEPTCEGYEFKGWEIVTDGVIRTGDDYFIMPDSDVVLRAKWSKVEIAKSMDGVVSTQGEPVMMGASWWNAEYQKDKVTSIEVKTTTAIPDSAIAYWDASQAQDKSVIAYIEDDGNGDYKVSIGGLGGVIANSDCKGLFLDFINTKTIMLDNFDTSNATNIAEMFYNCKSLLNLDLNNFKTQNVSEMYAMFRNCVSLTMLDVSSFSTQKLRNIDQMFMGCSNLAEINLNNFDTSNVIAMNSVFANCQSLKFIDLKQFDTSNVVRMQSMFSNCLSLTELDLSSFNTSNVMNMQDMFNGCNKLVNLDLSTFETSKVTNMSFMFSRCNSLRSLNFSNFDTSSVTSMSNMFAGCNNLSSLDVSNFDTSLVISMSSMFSGCTSLSSLDVSNFSTSKVTNMIGMFNECQSLVNLDVSNFDTSSVTNMQSMFQNCKSLTNLDVTHFDTSKVITMYYMFYGCIRLTDLDVSKFDTLKVTNMGYMFHSCRSLVNLDLSNFNTSNVTNMSNMFRDCRELSTLDLSKFDTLNVNNMYCLFYGCENLIELDVSNFNTTNVIDMGYMFWGCKKLTSLDLSNFDTSKVTNMHSMFLDCISLSSLDVSNFNTSKVFNMGSMFSGCNSLETLNLSRFDTSKVENMGYMFSNCYHLKNLDLSSFNTTNVIDMSYMFFCCSNLGILDMRSAEFISTSYHAMFLSVNSNVNVIVKDTTAQSWVRSRLDEGGRPDATVTIAGDLNAGVEGVSDSVDVRFRMEDTLDFDLLPLRYGVRFNMFSWL